MTHLMHSELEGKPGCGSDRRAGDAFLAQTEVIITLHNRRSQLDALPDRSLERLTFILGGKI